MKINLHGCNLEPSMTVIETDHFATFEDVYAGVIFVTRDGACLTVMMRDDGYEFYCWKEEAGQMPDHMSPLPKGAIMFSVDPQRGVRVDESEDVS